MAFGACFAETGWVDFRVALVVRWGGTGVVPQVRLPFTVRHTSMVVGRGELGRTVGTAAGAEMVVVGWTTVLVGAPSEVDPEVLVPIVPVVPVVPVPIVVVVRVGATVPTVGTVVEGTTTGAMAAGAGKLFGQPSGYGASVGFAVSSAWQPTPTGLAPIHCGTCQLTLSPTRTPSGHRPGHTLFHVTV